MNRLLDFEFDGQKYPLTLSMRAAGRLAARHGSVFATVDAIKHGAENEYENIVHALDILNSQAVEYMRLVQSDETGNKLPEELAVRMSLRDAVLARTAIVDAINLSLTATVEVEQDPKNAETTQE